MTNSCAPGGFIKVTERKKKSSCSKIKLSMLTFHLFCYSLIIFYCLAFFVNKKHFPKICLFFHPD